MEYLGDPNLARVSCALLDIDYFEYLKFAGRRTRPHAMNLDQARSNLPEHVPGTCALKDREIDGLIIDTTSQVRRTHPGVGRQRENGTRAPPGIGGYDNHVVVPASAHKLDIAPSHAPACAAPATPVRVRVRAGEAEDRWT